MSSLASDSTPAKSEILILTCERDRPWMEAATLGLDRFWPELPYQVVLDTDRETESQLPDDVRDLVRRVPYMRRIFDFPLLTDAETIYILDSDILIFDRPHDFGPAAYQGVPGNHDDLGATLVWRELGFEMPRIGPRFCCGMFSAPRAMWLDNRDLAIDYARFCIRYGYDRKKYGGVTCEQGFLAGLWRITNEDNPLPFDRYPIEHFTPSPAIVHVGSLKNSRRTEKWPKRYKELCDSSSLEPAALLAATS